MFNCESMNYSLGILLLVAFQFLFHDIAECEVCQTKSCHLYAKELKISMNNQADPCNDFSDYICGNIEKLYPMPLGQDRIDPIMAAENEVANDFKNLLDNLSLKNENDPKSKAAIFYKSCTDVESRNNNAKKEIAQFVKDIFQGETYEDYLANLLLTGMTSRIVTIRTFQDTQEPDNLILNIGKPGLILPEEILRFPDSNLSKQKFKQYRKFAKIVLDHLGIWNKQRKFIDDIIEFHSKIAQALPSIVDQLEPENYSNKVSILWLYENCPTISWLKLINGLFKNTNIVYNEKDTVILFSPEYIIRICTIIEDYKSKDKNILLFKKDIEWAAITSVSSLGSETLVMAYSQLVKDVYGENINSELWRKCMDITADTLVDIMGNIYVTKLFPDFEKTNVHAIVKHIKNVLHRIVQNAKWMDKETKDSAFLKLDTMMYKIGYSRSVLSEQELQERYRGVRMVRQGFLKNYVSLQAHIYAQQVKRIHEKLEKDQWYTGAHYTQPYYNTRSNEIVFPAGLLRYPFYDINLPLAINYGAFGSMFSHEILHAFDIEGSKFDENGRIQDWWTEQTEKGYSNEALCIAQQYQQYTQYNMTLPSNRTLQEDIADQGGVKIALKSYLQDRRVEEFMLPDLNFTPDQLFFVSYAKKLCAHFTKESLIHYMESNDYSIWKYRINVPLSNTPEFSKAFKCNKSKAMNPVKKCSIWG